MTGERRRTVLIADDDAAVRHVVARLVERHGWLAVEAHDGVDALDLIDALVVDLVVLDVSMPRLDGVSVLHHLRADPRRAEIPVVFLTGEDPASLHGLGAEAVIAKPFDSAAFADQLAAVMAGSADEPGSGHGLGRPSIAEAGSGEHSDLAGSADVQEVTVLVVDDEPDIRLLVRRFLNRAGVRVVEEAVDGADALAAVDRLDPPPIPTVMVLDNRMPYRTGLEVAEEVLARVPDQRIVLFSAHLNADVREQARDIGISACLAKQEIDRLPQLVLDLAGA